MTEEVNQKKGGKKTVFNPVTNTWSYKTKTGKTVTIPDVVMEEKKRVLAEGRRMLAAKRQVRKEFEGSSKQTTPPAPAPLPVQPSPVPAVKEKKKDDTTKMLAKLMKEVTEMKKEKKRAASPDPSPNPDEQYIVLDSSRAEHVKLLKDVLMDVEVDEDDH